MPAPSQPRPIASPRIAASLDPPPELPLHDEASHRGLALAGTALADRVATAPEFIGCRFTGVDLSGTTLRRAAFTDCRFERGNLANLRADRSLLCRVAVAGARLTGFGWVDGVLRDVTVTDCRADLASFRFTAFSAVAFERCNLARADFQNADLSGVRFTGCDLTGAQFSHAKMAGTRFASCDLSGVGGVTSFAGAVVAGHDLLALSHTLAAALGITIEP